MVARLLHEFKSMHAATNAAVGPWLDARGAIRWAARVEAIASLTGWLTSRQGPVRVALRLVDLSGRDRQVAPIGSPATSVSWSASLVRRSRPSRATCCTGAGPATDGPPWSKPSVSSRAARWCRSGLRLSALRPVRSDPNRRELGGYWLGEEGRSDPATGPARADAWEHCGINERRPRCTPARQCRAGQRPH
jgi:hypothetical protein